jgi:uncharacterized membrane protein YphA (DoxX/SURF4 family)
VDVIVLIGRILFCFLFLTSGYGPFRATQGHGSVRGVARRTDADAGRARRRSAAGSGRPHGVAWNLADLGALLLVVFLLPTAVLVHGFWKDKDPQSRQTEIVQFSKDTALAGASLMLFALFSFAGHDLGLMITGPLFNIS